MVRSLIKHEIKQTWQPLAILFGVTVIVSLVASAMTWASLPPFFEMGLLLGFLSSLSLPGVTMIALAVLYWNSSYRRRGYLTHTIPVRGSVVYWAKLGWGVLVTILSVIVTLLLAQLHSIAAHESDGAFFAGDVFIGPIGAIRYAFGLHESAPWWFWVGLAITVFFWLNIGLLQMFFAVSIGSEKRFLPLGAAGPILVWVILHVAMQILMVLAIVLTPAVIHMGGSVWFEWVSPLDLMTDPLSTDGFPLGVIVATVVFGIALVWRTKISWDKKVSLA